MIFESQFSGALEKNAGDERRMQHCRDSFRDFESTSSERGTMVKPFLSWSTVSLTPAIVIGRRRRMEAIMMVGSMLTTTLMGTWHLNVLPHAKVFSGSASTHELIAKSLFVSIKPPQLSKGLPVDVFTRT